MLISTEWRLPRSVRLIQAGNRRRMRNRSGFIMDFFWDCLWNYLTGIRLRPIGKAVLEGMT